jgi:hypothetical protein
MSAGLLLDGQPYGDDDMDNSARIEGPRPRNEAERTRACGRTCLSRTSWGKKTGIARARRDATGLRDTPEAYAAIVELHQQERERRRRAS